MAPKVVVVFPSDSQYSAGVANAAPAFFVTGIAIICSRICNDLELG